MSAGKHHPTNKRPTKLALLEKVNHLVVNEGITDDEMDTLNDFKDILESGRTLTDLEIRDLDYLFRTYR